MPSTIFFSWQSDTPPRDGRNFIERALQSAISNLSLDVDFQEAIREELVIDRDTQNIPGSPRIFQAILRKIDTATIVVPDFTFVASRPNGQPTPNPNVLIEYGYALKSLGEYRIIAVMNEAYGKPTRETMPFDLMELRYPITYSLPGGADDATRRTVREQLTKAFESALKVFFSSEEYRNTLPKPLPIIYREPKEGKARFRAKGEAIGALSDIGAEVIGASQGKLFLADGPSMWLRVAPQSPLTEKRKIQDLAASAQKIILLPFNAPSGTIAAVRGPDGCGFYFPSGSKKATPSLAYIFTDGEIWAINTLFLSLRPNLILLEEAKFAISLQQCADFLNDIGIPGPYRWVAGMEGVQDRALYEDNLRRESGLCMSDVIEAKGTFNIGDDPVKTLEPLFESVFEACGVNRGGP